jgi:hypothetical protein
MLLLKHIHARTAAAEAAGVGDVFSLGFFREE